MQAKIIEALEKALQTLKLNTTVILTPAKGHGDFATNVALKLAQTIKQKPLDLAHQIVSVLKSPLIARAEVAAPGFINIFLSPKSFQLVVKQVLQLKSRYGRGSQGKFINVEYVSANPTGFLHLGHGANAALGSSLSNILKFAGNKVVQEYYVNDSGNQINTLAHSTFLRYQELLGAKIALPEASYHGSEIIAAAQLIVEKFGNKYLNAPFNQRVKALFAKEAKAWMLAKIKLHLFDFGVNIDRYYFESKLYKNNLILDALCKIPGLYEKDGATWVPTSQYGDDKDRVVIKQDKTFTYFAPDIAYHDIKLSKGYDELINVWGADHIGYVLRMKIALKLLGLPSDKLDILTLQMVRLIKDGKEFKMSKRSGTSFTLKDLLNLVGKDAARFFLINRGSNTQLDFDISLATKKSQENPVFSVQYSHARANQLIKKSKVKPLPGTYVGQELALINLLADFPEVINHIAKSHKVHLLPQYLIELARSFNSFYSNPNLKIIGSEREASLIALVTAVKQVLNNGLSLIEVLAPEKM